MLRNVIWRSRMIVLAENWDYKGPGTVLLSQLASPPLECFLSGNENQAGSSPHIRNQYRGIHIPKEDGQFLLVDFRNDKPSTYSRVCRMA